MGLLGRPPGVAAARPWWVGYTVIGGGSPLRAERPRQQRGIARQELLRAVTDVQEHLGDRADTLHRSGGLAHPDGMDVGIPLEDRPKRIQRGQLFSPPPYLGLAAVPLVGDAVGAGPSGNSRGKPHVVHDVPDLGVHGVLPIALDDALLVTVRDLHGLVRREERCAEPGALTTRRQHSSKGPPAGDAPGGDHGGAAGHLEHLSQERKRSEASGVTAGLVSLGHEDVGAQVQGEASRFRSLDLAENLGSRSLGFRHIRRRITEREREDRDALVQAGAKVLDPLGNLLRDEADPERFARVGAHEADLLPDPCRAAAIDAAKEPEPSRRVDGRGETATGGPSAEWRQHDARVSPNISVSRVFSMGNPPPVGMVADMRRVVSRHRALSRTSPRREVVERD